MGKRLERNFTKKDIWVANKHMKSYSTLPAIREMQIKFMMRYHYIRMAKIKITENTIFWQGHRDTESFIRCW